MKKYSFYLGLGFAFVLGISNAFAEDAGVWNTTKGIASDTWDGAKKVTGDVWDGAKKVTGDVWAGAKEVGSDVKDGMSDDKPAQTDTSAHDAQSHESQNHNEHSAE
jgi:hypothetical protein